MTSVVVLAGGLDVPHMVVPSGAIVIAADGGADVAAGLGLTVDLVVGDLDSISAEALAGVRVDAQIGGAVVHVIRGERTLAGEPGELISLFAVGGPADGVVADGLVYPLRGESLGPGSTRGLSN